MRRLLITVTASVVMLGGSGALNPAITHAAAPAHAVASRAGMSLVQAQRWLDQQHTALQTLGAVELDTPGLFPAGRLGGRTHASVLDVREAGEGEITLRAPASTPPGLSYAITARDGRTGHAWWSRTLPPLKEGNRYALEEPVGATGRLGVIIVTESVTGPMTASTFSLTMRALSGVSGRTLWSRTLTSSKTTGIPAAPFLFHQAGKPYVDLFVDSVTYSGTMTLTASTSAAIIDGSSGEMGPYGASHPALSGVAVEQPVPDVNGDGTSDIALLVPSSVGAVGYVSLLSGTDAGVTLWTRSLDLVDPSISSIGAFSHAGYPDLVVSNDDYTVKNQKTWVLAGRTGAVVLMRNTTSVFAIHRAGPSSHPAILVATVEFKDPTPTTPGSAHKAMVVAHWVAVNASNAVIYSKELGVSLTVKSPPEYNDGIDVIGDLQADGSDDLELNLELSTATQDVKHFGVIDGRTGAFHPVDFDEASVGSLTSGGATDLLRSTVVGGHPLVTAIRGETRKVLYKRTIAGLSRQQYAGVTGLRATGHACSDLALVATRAKAETYAMLSGSGALLWKVQFAPSALTGGTLEDYPAPTHYCLDSPKG